MSEKLKYREAKEPTLFEPDYNEDGSWRERQRPYDSYVGISVLDIIYGFAATPEYMMAIEKTDAPLMTKHSKYRATDKDWKDLADSFKELVI